MSESIERKVRITVEASDGETPAGLPIWSGFPGTVEILPDLNDESRAAVEALRAYTVQRMDWWLAVLAVTRHGDPDRPETKLDFSLPNQPTEDQVDGLLTRARHVVDALEVLKQLAPWTYDDGDGDDEDEPVGPDPEPSVRGGGENSD